MTRSVFWRRVNELMPAWLEVATLIVSDHNSALDLGSYAFAGVHILCVNIASYHILSDRSSVQTLRSSTTVQCDCKLKDYVWFFYCYYSLCSSYLIFIAPPLLSRISSICRFHCWLSSFPFPFPLLSFTVFDIMCYIYYVRACINTFYSRPTWTMLSTLTFSNPPWNGPMGQLVKKLSALWRPAQLFIMLSHFVLYLFINQSSLNVSNLCAFWLRTKQSACFDSYTVSMWELVKLIPSLLTPA